MLPTLDDVGHALAYEEETALLSALQSRSRLLYPAVMLALNTGMRYGEIRLLQWKQLDFGAKMLTVGKSKTRTGTGRFIPLNARILSVLKMRVSQFPDLEASHYIFPLEKCGASGEQDTFRFTGSAVFYSTEPTRPIGDWKKAWEKAKERAASILRGDSGNVETNRQSPASENPSTNRSDKAGRKKPTPESLKCRFHDLRHTAVTRLLEAGIPYPVVASIPDRSAATASGSARAVQPH
jgi:integrase